MEDNALERKARLIEDTVDDLIRKIEELEGELDIMTSENVKLEDKIDELNGEIADYECVLESRKH